MEKIKVIESFHFLPSLSVRSGGIATAVAQLTDALAEDTEIATNLLSANSIGKMVSSKSTKLIRSNFGINSKYNFFSGPIKSILNDCLESQTPKVFHAHGLWAPLTHHVCVYARSFGIPLIVQPHGMLDPWSLNNRSFKKRIAMILYQRKDLTEADLICATSEKEYLSVRALGFKQPVSIIPNGVEIVDGSSPEYSQTKSREFRTVLFLSRIHPVKGLLNLINAWSMLRPDGWLLYIAGPDEVNHLEEVKKLVCQLSLESKVVLLGEVYDNKKAEIFEYADIFVLPTYSESFGIVVAEALAYGLPVITTKGTPWSDLEVLKCGWWIDIGVEPLVKALHAAVSLTDNQRRAMGERGREYAKHFSWSAIANETVTVYKWLLDKGEKPDCVITD